MRTLFTGKGWRIEPSEQVLFIGGVPYRKQVAIYETAPRCEDGTTPTRVLAWCPTEKDAERLLAWIDALVNRKMPPDPTGVLE